MLKTGNEIIHKPLCAITEMNGYKIIWKNTEIGYLMNAMPDMWYLEGIYHPNSTELSKQFVDLVSEFNAKLVMTDPTKGIRAKLKVCDEELINVAIISLGKNNELFVRQVMNEQGISWLIENVPEEK